MGTRRRLAQPEDTQLQSWSATFRLAGLAIPAAQLRGGSAAQKTIQRIEKSVSPDAEETLQPEQKDQVRADAPAFPKRILRIQRAISVAKRINAFRCDDVVNVFTGWRYCK